MQDGRLSNNKKDVRWSNVTERRVSVHQAVKYDTSKLVSFYFYFNISNTSPLAGFYDVLTSLRQQTKILMKINISSYLIHEEKSLQRSHSMFYIVKKLTRGTGTHFMRITWFIWEMVWLKTEPMKVKLWHTKHLTKISCSLPKLRLIFCRV